MSSVLVLGIAGGTGSGKTTIANKIVEQIAPRAICIDHDSYYRDLAHLSFEERQQVNFDHPDSLDNELLMEHLRALRAGRPIEKPVYDFKRHVRTEESSRIEPAPVVVVEGILTLAILALRDLFDIKIFVDTAADIRLIRRVRRDLEQRGREFSEVREQYYKTVRPMHMAFVEPSKQFADVIIPEGGANRIAIELIVGRIHHYLHEQSLTAK